METRTVLSSRLPSRFMVGVSAGGCVVFTWCLSGLMDCYCCCFSDVFVSTFERDAPLQHQIHNLCEAWWKKDLKEKEKFGRTAFFMSLKNIVALKKPVSV